MKKLKLKKETCKERIKKILRKTSLFKKNQPLYSFSPGQGKEIIENHSKDSFTFKYPIK